MSDHIVSYWTQFRRNKNYYAKITNFTDKEWPSAEPVVEFVSVNSTHQDNEMEITDNFIKKKKKKKILHICKLFLLW